MALDDYAEAEVGVAMAATAAVLSPRVRGWMRKGVVYAFAGALAGGDTVLSAGRRVVRVGRGPGEKAKEAPAARAQRRTSEPAAES